MALYVVVLVLAVVRVITSITLLSDDVGDISIVFAKIALGVGIFILVPLLVGVIVAGVLNSHGYLILR